MTDLATGLVVRADAKVCHVDVGGRRILCAPRGRLYEEGRRQKNPIAVGDRVVTANAVGAYAEYSCAPSDLVAYVPDSVPSDAIASALLKGMTAQYLFRQVHPLQGGETVLYHAAAGGVGLVAHRRTDRHLTGGGEGEDD